MDNGERRKEKREMKKNGIQYYELLHSFRDIWIFQLNYNRLYLELDDKINQLFKPTDLIYWSEFYF